MGLLILYCGRYGQKVLLFEDKYFREICANTLFNFFYEIIFLPSSLWGGTRHPIAYVKGLTQQLPFMGVL